MKAKRKQVVAEPVKNRRSFWCETCGSRLPMSGPELKLHLREVHKVTEITGTKKGIAFIDSEEGYSNTYQLVIGGVRVTEVATGPKGGHW